MGLARVFDVLRALEREEVYYVLSGGVALNFPGLSRAAALLLALVLMPAAAVRAADCSVKTEEREVRGTSLSGLVNPGQTVKIAFGFYACHDVKRNDIVAYNYAGNSVPIIKVVKGLPGDKFHLEKADGGWHVKVNGKALKTSLRKPYLLDERGRRMLALYEDSYHGVIPPSAYLILGNLVEGTMDSSRFGLVDKGDILGKVLLKR